jgi:hypothetical protein
MQQTEPLDLDYKWSEDLGYSGAFAPSAPSRALQSGRERNDTLDRMVRLFQLERDEKPLLLDVQKIVAQQESAKVVEEKSAARLEVQWAQMPAYQANEIRAQYFKDKEIRDQNELEALRDYSQIITRVSVQIDTVCKMAIVQLAVGQEMRFTTPGFIIWFGKTRNMSAVNNAFRFPDSYVVPVTAGSEPTATTHIRPTRTFIRPT